MHSSCYLLCWYTESGAHEKEVFAYYGRLWQLGGAEGQAALIASGS